MSPLYTVLFSTTLFGTLYSTFYLLLISLRILNINFSIPLISLIAFFTSFHSLLTQLFQPNIPLKRIFLVAPAPHPRFFKILFFFPHFHIFSNLSGTVHVWYIFCKFFLVYPTGKIISVAHAFRSLRFGSLCTWTRHYLKRNFL